MNQITLTIDADKLREVMMALCERRHQLSAEMTATKSDEVWIIANRQWHRVTEAMQEVQQHLGEVWV